MTQHKGAGLPEGVGHLSRRPLPPATAPAEGSQQRGRCPRYGAARRGEARRGAPGCRQPLPLRRGRGREGGRASEGCGRRAATCVALRCAEPSRGATPASPCLSSCLPACLGGRPGAAGAAPRCPSRCEMAGDGEGRGC